MPRSRLLLLLVLCSGFAARAGEVRFQLTDAKDAPVADAVVSLTPLDAPVPAPAPSPACEIVQSDKEFTPYVTAVRVGTRVSFPNRDQVEHHVYSLSKPKKFEFPLYKPGKAEEMVFDQPGEVAIGCSIHDWMASYVVVLETPWFAVSPGSGTTVVAGIPPGRYRAKIWHPRLAEPVSREITVTETAPAEALGFKLKLKADLRRRAPDAGRGTYK